MKDYERVSADEAIRLAGHQTFGTMDYVKEIVEAEAQRMAALFPTQSATFNLMFGALAAYEAGRVTGIRTERARRKAAHI